MLLETRECGSTRYRYNEKASAGLNGPGYVGWYLCRRFYTCLHNYRARAPPLCSQSIARLRDLRSGDWRGTRKLGGEETRKLLGEEVWVWD